ncbi:MAG TPA: hypothetical protein VFX49_21465 [Chloroflexota bacterium]|nr:hypothetical protein [Chloroflexota bacterium]
MPRTSSGQPKQPNQRHWADAKATRAESDAADLQRLIRYVERWRMAHFQSPDRSSVGATVRIAGDRRISDADVLLQKLRAGLSIAASEANGAMRAGGQAQPMFA